MKVLLDTHALLWWLAGDDRLPRHVQTVIADPGTSVAVSAASAWEIATKVRIGKMPSMSSWVDDLVRLVRDQEFQWVPISESVALRAGLLPFPHRDPFDRLLIAQAIACDWVLVSNEAIFDGAGVRRMW